uniref:Uncharacterized protein n=1 Tax=Tanacetum cinerariifolium TaxID=118510 RepID=A0A699KU46_TANCI|nr:hypothetical protein [Tanacetum cinerariifolium]
MHNDIMAVSFKECPSMLAPGRYAQWQSRFLRYVDTKPNKKELKQCIYDGPYVMTKILILAKPAIVTQEAVHEHRVPETYGNTTPEKYAYFDAETAEIHMILSGIRYETYSTVDECTISKEMKPKRAKYYAYHKEKMMLCKHEEKGMPLSVEQDEWLYDTDEEPDEHEFEAHYIYKAKI